MKKKLPYIRAINELIGLGAPLIKFSGRKTDLQRKD